MQIIAVIVLTLAFWAVYWFIRMGGIDHLREKAAQRRDEARRTKSLEQWRSAPLRTINDPRDAATILMLLIARGRDPTPEQIAAIESTLRSVFGFAAELTERMTQARFVASRADSFEQATRLFTELLRKQLTRDERLELIAMVEEVARLDGPTPAQTAAIAALKEQLGLSPAP